MSKKDMDQNKPESQQEEVPEEPVQEAEQTPEEALQAAIREQEDKYLRLLAEYDNYRKRSQKEKENAWTSAKADTAKEFLPVYDNLERALKQETADEAYAKGVQMIMTQLKNVLEKLGIEEIPAQGETFDPNVHNAVMHIDDEELGENVVAEVFQAGFRIGDKVIRHAMVKVAN
ncbi:nucleotide exchange factor GrpE [Evtepia sp.]|uniref:nucleotide exchange factor GrpE n=1 Tax=Evtepia sp. TaxID=2773933 RepID=UPI003F1538AB